MRKVALFFLIIITVFLVGCDKKPSVIIDAKDSNTPIDLSKVITLGNHSYVPINLSEDLSKHARIILRVINEFEKNHPELEITDWKLWDAQKNQTENDIFTEKDKIFIYGIWIDHEPKNNISEFSKIPHFLKR